VVREGGRPDHVRREVVGGRDNVQVAEQSAPAPDYSQMNMEQLGEVWHEVPAAQRQEILTQIQNDYGGGFNSTDDANRYYMLALRDQEMQGINTRTPANWDSPESQAFYQETVQRTAAASAQRQAEIDSRSPEQRAAHMERKLSGTAVADSLVIDSGFSSAELIAQSERVAAAVAAGDPRITTSGLETWYTYQNAALKGANQKEVAEAAAAQGLIASDFKFVDTGAGFSMTYALAAAPDTRTWTQKLTDGFRDLYSGASKNVDYADTLVSAGNYGAITNPTGLSFGRELISNNGSPLAPQLTAGEQQSLYIAKLGVTAAISIPISAALLPASAAVTTGSVLKGAAKGAIGGVVLGQGFKAGSVLLDSSQENSFSNMVLSPSEVAEAASLGIIFSGASNVALGAVKGVAGGSVAYRGLSFTAKRVVDAALPYGVNVPIGGGLSAALAMEHTGSVSWQDVAVGAGMAAAFTAGGQVMGYAGGKIKGNIQGRVQNIIDESTFRAGQAGEPYQATPRENLLMKLSGVSPRQTVSTAGTFDIIPPKGEVISNTGSYRTGVRGLSAGELVDIVLVPSAASQPSSSVSGLSLNYKPGLIVTANTPALSSSSKTPGFVANAFGDVMPGRIVDVFKGNVPGLARTTSQVTSPDMIQTDLVARQSASDAVTALASASTGNRIIVTRNVTFERYSASLPQSSAELPTLGLSDNKPTVFTPAEIIKAAPEVAKALQKFPNVKQVRVFTGDVPAEVYFSGEALNADNQEAYRSRPKRPESFEAYPVDDLLVAGPESAEIAASLPSEAILDGKVSVKLFEALADPLAQISASETVNSVTVKSIASESPVSVDRVPGHDVTRSTFNLSQFPTAKNPTVNESIKTGNYLGDAKAPTVLQRGMGKTSNMAVKRVPILGQVFDFKVTSGVNFRSKNAPLPKLNSVTDFIVKKSGRVQSVLSGTSRSSTRVKSDLKLDQSVSRSDVEVKPVDLGGQVLDNVGSQQLEAKTVSESPFRVEVFHAAPVQVVRQSAVNPMAKTRRVRGRQDDEVIYAVRPGQAGRLDQRSVTISGLAATSVVAQGVVSETRNDYGVVGVSLFSNQPVVEVVREIQIPDQAVIVDVTQAQQQTQRQDQVQRQDQITMQDVTQDQATSTTPILAMGRGSDFRFPPLGSDFDRRNTNRKSKKRSSLHGSRKRVYPVASADMVFNRFSAGFNPKSGGGVGKRKKSRKSRKGGKKGSKR
jgi:hypothetical protein